MPAKQLYRGWRHQPSFVHIRAVINVLFIPRQSLTFCLYQWRLPTRTSGLVEASVLMACIRQLSGCDGICGIAAWRNAVLEAAGSLAGWFWLCPAPWAAWIHCRGRQFLAGQRRWSAVCPGEQRVAAGDTQSQASFYKLPQPLYLE